MPSPIYTWYKNGIPLPTDSSEDNRFANTSFSYDKSIGTLRLLVSCNFIKTSPAVNKLLTNSLNTLLFSLTSRKSMTQMLVSITATQATVRAGHPVGQ